jgi:hypothetical protein
MIKDIFDSTRMKKPMLLAQDTDIPDIFVPLQLAPVDPDTDGLGGWLP